MLRQRKRCLQPQVLPKPVLVGYFCSHMVVLICRSIPTEDAHGSCTISLEGRTPLKSIPMSPTSSLTLSDPTPRDRPSSTISELDQGDGDMSSKQEEHESKEGSSEEGSVMDTPVSRHFSPLAAGLRSPQDEVDTPPATEVKFLPFPYLSWLQTYPYI